MTKVTIDRELLERANSLLCSYSSTLADRAVTRRAISEICAILAAPRQPEGDYKPDRNKAFDACPDAGCDWGAFWQGWKACHADHLRAIAELREECERVKAYRASCWAEFKVMTRSCLEAEKERDTLRQQLAEAQSNTDKWCDVACSQRDEADRIAAQRDKLAGLLREAAQIIDRLKGDPVAAGEVLGDIDAALAEVNK